jgi:hypothetical protein
MPNDNRGIFLVVVQDTVIESREYAVIADSVDDAKEKVSKGQFLTESERTVMDTEDTKIVSAEKVGTLSEQWEAVHKNGN